MFIFNTTACTTEQNILNSSEFFHLLYKNERFFLLNPLIQFCNIQIYFSAQRYFALCICKDGNSRRWNRWRFARVDGNCRKTTKKSGLALFRMNGLRMTSPLWYMPLKQNRNYGIRVIHHTKIEIKRMLFGGISKKMCSTAK